MSRLRPAPEQIEATDPRSSNWVGANAGSGKTHVLTQRVARLLLEGAEPQKILCLTYTRAAAAEMQSRLFRTLGAWAMAPEDKLALTLADLSGATEPVRDPAQLVDARRLFARALETPGGLKIQTIHAFCTEVLRRFPLEAGVSPRFEIADDRRSLTMMAEIRAQLAESAEDAFDGVARLISESGIDGLADAILRSRDSFGGDLEACIEAHFGGAGSRTSEEIAAAALNRLDRAEMKLLQATLDAHGGKVAKNCAAAIADWLADHERDPLESCDSMAGVLLTKTGTPRKLETKGLIAAAPDILEKINYLQDWAAEIRRDFAAARITARVRALHGFADSLLQRHENAKALAALLDYDDLVRRTARLVSDGTMREWVLWKLDQGLDHILVDEAQDTSPAQWEVIAAIAEEFFAGHGARPEGRSIFVVGDEKQSIYSFQGAEPAAFGRMRQHFAERVEAMGAPLGQPNLLTSYRSAPAILEFADAVFAGDAGEGLTISGEPIRHVAHREGAHGRVDLWPVIEAEEKPQEVPWFEPVDAVPASDTKERLAVAVADQIGGMIGREWLGARPPARAARPVRAGDILVLVAKRDRLASGIIRELKKRNVAVAGADRMKLTAEIAVQDLLALAKVAVQPGDDLSLAALLKSPLCGLGEDELAALAIGRAGTLWQAVQGSEKHKQAAVFLADMAGQADFLRPYEFLERALIRHDGRRLLAARLGPEAEDAIDELLAQALAYEASEPPSLTGFIAWIEAAEIEVRREMEGGADMVRVMTIHGAKGLEAPVVILPDTISGGRAGRGPLLLPVPARDNAPALMLWLGSKDDDDALAAAARAEAEARDMAERKRLLYVALTRAEDWLILCGAGLRNNPKNTWYEMLEAGMAALADVKALPAPTGEGEMLRFETGPEPLSDEADFKAIAEPPPEKLPSWLAAAPIEARRQRFSPSALGAPPAEGGAGIGRETALAIGMAVHLLLEHLPDQRPEDHETLAAKLLAHELPGLDLAHRQDAWREAAHVMAMPEAELIFGADSLAEAAATMAGPDGQRMIGRIDRLVIGEDRILIVDFKTDRAPPETPEQVSEGYLAQLGAYQEALAAAFPDRRVEAALLWTARRELMRIDSSLIARAYQAALHNISDCYRSVDSVARST